MADGTKIEWTDATWNPITGCSVISPGCTNCYAMRLAGTRMQHHHSRAGLTAPSKAGPVWNGQVRLNGGWLAQPLHWKRPREIFVCAHADLFHDAVPVDWIDHILAVMALASHHRFQVLTKRSSIMRAYFADDGWRDRVAYQVEIAKPSELWNGNVVQARHELKTRGHLPNVWLGVSVEDQKRAEERIPDLLATPAAVRWISAEPLLGPVDLRRLNTMAVPGAEMVDALGGVALDFIDEPVRRIPRLDWVIVGGESGPWARPMHPDWARSLRDQCSLTKTPLLFKQWGEWAPGECAENTVAMRTVRTADWWDGGWVFEEMRGDFELHHDDEPTLFRVGKKAAGRLLDGVQHDGVPA